MKYDTSIHMNPDANAWAKFFMQTMQDNPNIVIDEGLMIGWFANAMMAMHDHLNGGEPINGDHAQHIAQQAASVDATFKKWNTPILDKYAPMQHEPENEPAVSLAAQAAPTKEQT